MVQYVLAWSGGKDAAFALHRLRENGISIFELWTTVNEATKRSSMHGVRRELYHKQAAAVGSSLRLLSLPDKVDNDTYRHLVQEELADYAEKGVRAISYADIALEDVRKYRQETLSDLDIEGDWPIWGYDTQELVSSIIDSGFEAIVVAINKDALDATFLGRQLDAAFLEDLPPSIDPAGENGEYHTFVTDGPIFEHPVSVKSGTTVERSLGDTTMLYLDIRSNH